MKQVKPRNGKVARKQKSVSNSSIEEKPTKERLGRLSLYPLTLDQALRGALQTKPMKRAEAR